MGIPKRNKNAPQDIPLSEHDKTKLKNQIKKELEKNLQRLDAIYQEQINHTEDRHSEFYRSPHFDERDEALLITDLASIATDIALQAGGSTALYSAGWGILTPAMALLVYPFITAIKQGISNYHDTRIIGDHALALYTQLKDKPRKERKKEAVIIDEVSKFIQDQFQTAEEANHARKIDYLDARLDEYQVDLEELNYEIWENECLSRAQTPEEYRLLKESVLIQQEINQINIEIYKTYTKFTKSRDLEKDNYLTRFFIEQKKSNTDKQANSAFKALIANHADSILNLHASPDAASQQQFHALLTELTKLDDDEFKTNGIIDNKKINTWLMTQYQAVVHRHKTEYEAMLTKRNQQLVRIKTPGLVQPTNSTPLSSSEQALEDRYHYLKRHLHYFSWKQKSENLLSDITQQLSQARLSQKPLATSKAISLLEKADLLREERTKERSEISNKTWSAIQARFPGLTIEAKGLAVKKQELQGDRHTKQTSFTEKKAALALKRQQLQKEKEELEKQHQEYKKDVDAFKAEKYQDITEEGKLWRQLLINDQGTWHNIKKALRNIPRKYKEKFLQQAIVPTGITFATNEISHPIIQDLRQRFSSAVKNTSDYSALLKQMQQEIQKKNAAMASTTQRPEEKSKESDKFFIPQNDDREDKLVSYDLNHSEDNKNIEEITNAFKTHPGIGNLLSRNHRAIHNTIDTSTILANADKQSLRSLDKLFNSQNDISQNDRVRSILKDIDNFLKDIDPSAVSTNTDKQPVHLLDKLLTPPNEEKNYLKNNEDDKNPREISKGRTKRAVTDPATKDFDTAEINTAEINNPTEAEEWNNRLTTALKQTPSTTNYKTSSFKKILTAILSNQNEKTKGTLLRLLAGKINHLPPLQQFPAWRDVLSHLNMADKTAQAEIANALAEQISPLLRQLRSLPKKDEEFLGYVALDEEFLGYLELIFRVSTSIANAENKLPYLSLIKPLCDGLLEIGNNDLQLIAFKALLSEYETSFANATDPELTKTLKQTWLSAITYTIVAKLSTSKWEALAFYQALLDKLESLPENELALLSLKESLSNLNLSDELAGTEGISATGPELLAILKGIYNDNLRQLSAQIKDLPPTEQKSAFKKVLAAIRPADKSQDIDAVFINLAFQLTFFTEEDQAELLTETIEKFVCLPPAQRNGLALAVLFSQSSNLSEQARLKLFNKIVPIVQTRIAAGEEMGDTLAALAAQIKSLPLAEQDKAWTNPSPKQGEPSSITQLFNSITNPTHQENALLALAPQLGAIPEKYRLEYFNKILAILQARITAGEEMSDTLTTLASQIKSLPPAEQDKAWTNPSPQRGESTGIAQLFNSITNPTHQENALLALAPQLGAIPEKYRLEYFNKILTIVQARISKKEEIGEALVDLAEQIDTLENGPSKTQIWKDLLEQTNRLPAGEQKDKALTSLCISIVEAVPEDQRSGVFAQVFSETTFQKMRDEGLFQIKPQDGYSARDYLHTEGANNFSIFVQNLKFLPVDKQHAAFKMLHQSIYDNDFGDNEDIKAALLTTLASGVANTDPSQQLAIFNELINSPFFSKSVPSPREIEQRNLIFSTLLTQIEKFSEADRLSAIGSAIGLLPYLNSYAADFIELCDKFKSVQSNNNQAAKKEWFQQFSKHVQGASRTAQFPHLSRIGLYLCNTSFTNTPPLTFFQESIFGPSYQLEFDTKIPAKDYFASDRGLRALDEFHLTINYTLSLLSEDAQHQAVMHLATRISGNHLGREAQVAQSDYRTVWFYHLILSMKNMRGENLKYETFEKVLQKARPITLEKIKYRTISPQAQTLLNIIWDTLNNTDQLTLSDEQAQTLFSAVRQNLAELSLTPDQKTDALAVLNNLENDIKKRQTERTNFSKTSNRIQGIIGPLDYAFGSVGGPKIGRGVKFTPSKIIRPQPFKLNSQKLPLGVNVNYRGGNNLQFRSYAGPWRLNYHNHSLSFRIGQANKLFGKASNRPSTDQVVNKAPVPPPSTNVASTKQVPTDILTQFKQRPDKPLHYSDGANNSFTLATVRNANTNADETLVFPGKLEDLNGKSRYSASNLEGTIKYTVHYEPTAKLLYRGGLRGGGNYEALQTGKPKVYQVRKADGTLAPTPPIIPLTKLPTVDQHHPHRDLYDRAVNKWNQLETDVKDFHTLCTPPGSAATSNANSTFLNKNTLSASYDLRSGIPGGPTKTLTGDVSLLSGESMPKSMKTHITNNGLWDEPAYKAIQESYKIKGPTTPRFKVFEVGHERLLDTEAKFFEKLAHDLDPKEQYSPTNPNKNVTGAIWLRSKLPVCESCQSVINQFQQTFPNVKIFVTDSKP